MPMHVAGLERARQWVAKSVSADPLTLTVEGQPRGVGIICSTIGHLSVTSWWLTVHTLLHIAQAYIAPGWVRQCAYCRRAVTT